MSSGGDFGVASANSLLSGKIALKLDVGVEVAEQDLRRGGPLERQRRMGDEQDRGEREANSRFHAPAGMR